MPRSTSHQLTEPLGSFSYQSLGYYVSLLAEARSQQPFPPLATIAGLQLDAQHGWLTEKLREILQRELAPLKKTALKLNIYFGQSEIKRYNKLARQLFNLLQIPLMQVYLERPKGQWCITGAKPLAINELPQQQRDFLVKAADVFLSGQKPSTLAREPCYRLAILHDPDNPEPPSNRKAMQKFKKAAEATGLRAQFITRNDFSRLDEFDALFIRDTTFANHYTYEFSRQAEAMGLVVIDDSASILKRNNKVYLTELFARHHLPAPKTLFIHKGNIDQALYSPYLIVMIEEAAKSLVSVWRFRSKRWIHDLVNTSVG